MTERDTLNDDDVARLSDALRDQLAPSRHSRPVPGVASASRTTGVDPVVIGSRPRRRRTAALSLIAAAAAAAIVLPLTFGAPGAPGDAAWAADPAPVTDELVATVTAACAETLAPRTGGEQHTGTTSALGASPDGTTPPTPPPPADVVAPPSELPALAALDIRGDGGFAVFSTGDQGDATTIIFCAVTVGGSVTVTGLSSQVGAPTGGDDRVTAQTGTSIAGVTDVSTLTGSLAAGAESVVVSVPGLPDARATVVDGQYAIWWPGLANATVRQLAADGSVVSEMQVG